MKYKYVRKLEKAGKKMESKERIGKVLYRNELAKYNKRP